MTLWKRFIQLDWLAGGVPMSADPVQQRAPVGQDQFLRGAKSEHHDRHQHPVVLDSTVLSETSSAADRSSNVSSHRFADMIGGRDAPVFPRASLTCGSRTISYAIRLSAHARYLSLTIGPETGLIVTVPRRAQQSAITVFLKRHERWILRQIERLESIAVQIPRRWPYGSTLPYRGAEHRVLLEETKRASQVVYAIDQALVVHMRRVTIEGARRLLKRCYMAQAPQHLTGRSAAFGHQFGIQWKRLTVRDQRRRWGSCSVGGCLTFNYRLVMAPDDISDYVVLHELMHRRELNHSRKFWALVAAACPEYRQRRTWLSTFGSYLTL